MKTINYWFTEDEDYEFNISNHDVRAKAKEWLSDFDKNSLLDFIMDNVSTDDLFDYFAEQFEEYYEAEARDLYFNG